MSRIYPSRIALGSLLACSILLPLGCTPGVQTPTKNGTKQGSRGRTKEYVNSPEIHVSPAPDLGTSIRQLKDKSIVVTDGSVHIKTVGITIDQLFKVTGKTMTLNSGAAKYEDLLVGDSEYANCSSEECDTTIYRGTDSDSGDSPGTPLLTIKTSSDGSTINQVTITSAVAFTQPPWTKTENACSPGIVCSDWQYGAADDRIIRTHMELPNKAWWEHLYGPRSSGGTDRGWCGFELDARNP